MSALRALSCKDIESKCKTLTKTYIVIRHDHTTQQWMKL